MRKFVRAVLWLVVAAAAAAVVVVVVLLAGAGASIKAAVNELGPPLLGVPVSLKEAKVRVFAGRAELKGLHVGNPPGYHTASMLDVSDVVVDLDTLSLLGGTVHVRRIEIRSPQFTFERSADGSNFKALREKLGIKKPKAAPEPAPPGPAPAPQQPAAKKKEPRKVIIDEFVISSPQLNASHVSMGGGYVAVPLGALVVTNIGTAEGGVTFEEAVKIIVASATRQIEEAVDAMVAPFKDAAKELKKNGGPLVDALRDAFGGGRKKDRRDRTAQPVAPGPVPQPVEQVNTNPPAAQPPQPGP